MPRARPHRPSALGRAPGASPAHSSAKDQRNVPYTVPELSFPWVSTMSPGTHSLRTSCGREEAKLSLQSSAFHKHRCGLLLHLWYLLARWSPLPMHHSPHPTASRLCCPTAVSPTVLCHAPLACARAGSSLELSCPTAPSPARSERWPPWGGSACLSSPDGSAWQGGCCCDIKGPKNILGKELLGTSLKF